MGGKDLRIQCNSMKPRCCKTAEEEATDSIFVLEDGRIAEMNSPEARKFRDYMSLGDDVSSNRTVTVEFMDGDDPRVILFSQRLLGMVIRNASPAEVERVVPGSHAASLGVKAGWRLSKIEGEDMHEANAATVRDKINELCQHLPSVYQIVMSFEDEGETKSIIFSRAPMGLRFWAQSPFKVEEVKPGSFADEQGVRSGWKLLSVAGQDVEDMRWEDVMQTIEDHAKILPSD